MTHPTLISPEANKTLAAELRDAHAQIDVLKTATRQIIEKADNLIAAIDGATDQFDNEVGKLSVAVVRMETLLDGHSPIDFHGLIKRLLDWNAKYPLSAATMPREQIVAAEIELDDIITDCREAMEL